MSSPPDQDRARKLAISRILAFSIDWLVIIAYGTLLFLLQRYVYTPDPDLFVGVWRAQGMYFCIITLPVILYFTFCESSGMQASLGKLAMGLKVVGIDGQRITLGRAFGRNLGKFFAWELGHLAVNHFVQLADQELPVWVFVVSGLAQLIVVLFVIQLFLTGRTVYDYLADTWVDSRALRS
ncbi:MAG: RDD family protein [Planctomycetota bacterium]|jgi:uncharacterized RDD family membrane protein YckC